MTDEVQVEQRLRDLANQIDPTMVGGRDAALLLEAADRIATIQRQDERVRESPRMVKLIQALHAGISNRSWQDVERAANHIRDEFVR